MLNNKVYKFGIREPVGKDNNFMRNCKIKLRKTYCRD